MAKHLFTSESVSEGHPDKIADQISDAVLDAILTQDPKARVACETYVKTGMVLVRYARFRILSQDRVQHRIGDLVSSFIRMSF